MYVFVLVDPRTNLPSPEFFWSRRDARETRTLLDMGDHKVRRAKLTIFNK